MILQSCDRQAALARPASARGSGNPLVDKVNYFSRQWIVRQHVDSVRSFNRFYTKQLGLLRKGYLESPFSLAEVRVLYELANRKRPIASEIANDLGLDAGYLSRLLANFERRGLISRKASRADGRRSCLSLTGRGRSAFAPLEVQTQSETSANLKKLSPNERSRLVTAMQTIENLLGEREAQAPAYTLRPHRPGDIGWVAHRHGALYAEEYGWDERFEALVAGIVANFVENFDPKCERCWIAERAGEIIGSVFLVKKSARVGKLRLLLVEPSARGLGLGKRLVEECVAFARQAGYRKITLWTQSNLYAARHIYAKAGFQLVKKERHRNFGFNLISETWDLTL